jgi:succinate dehydrogenase / fumarate reductase, iron-sulfur subunit
MFDCTHCFKCVDACPKDVNPMGQIMRLRRIATADHHIVDQNNGERHEAAFASLIRDNGLLWEAELLPRSYGGNSWLGKLHPRTGKELISSLPSIVKALVRGKVTPMGALKPHRIPRQDLKAVQSIYERIDGRDRSSGQRYELNLYVVGEDEEPPPAVPVLARGGAEGGAIADEPTVGPVAEQEKPAEPTSPDPSTSA